MKMYMARHVSEEVGSCVQSFNFFAPKEYGTHPGEPESEEVVDLIRKELNVIFGLQTGVSEISHHWLGNTLFIRFFIYGIGTHLVMWTQ